MHPDIKLKDIGFASPRSESKLFKELGIPIVMRYFDPSYLNPEQSSQTRLMRSCVICMHAQRRAVLRWAGEHGLVIGYLHDAFIHTPLLRCCVLEEADPTPMAFGGRPF